MPVADDYFAAGIAVSPLAAPAPSCDDPVETAHLGRSRRGIPTVIGVVAVFIASVGAVVVAARRTHPNVIVDTRPLGLPAAIDGLPQATKLSGQAYGAISNPRWAARYRGSSFETAVYGEGHAVATLIAGRGPIGQSVTLDLGSPSANHRVFGDVTCADFFYRGPSMLPTFHHDQDMPGVDLCWYSSPTFSVGIGFSNTDDDSAAHAQALDAALPILENDGAH